MSICCICSQIAGDAETDLLHHHFGGSYKRRVLLETKHFAVLPSVGPVVAGHVLIVPKEHYTRLAALSLHVAEYVKLEARVRSLLADEYEVPIHVFEHGSDAAETTTPCSVGHAHSHLLPADVSISESLHAEYEWRFAESSLRIQRAEEYLFYHAPGAQPLVTFAINESTFPSQYLRKLLATVLGAAALWNWREYPRLELIQETLTRFRVPVVL